MSEDRIANQDGRSFEERVFARFDALDTRLTTLEDKVDRRLKETRPIWEQVLERLNKVEERFSQVEEKLSQVDDSLRRVGRKFDMVAKDMMQLREDQLWIERRVDKLEAERVKS